VGLLDVQGMLREKGEGKKKEGTGPIVIREPRKKKEEKRDKSGLWKRKIKTGFGLSQWEVDV